MVAELAVGEEFAGHRIERLLGRGGMGVVYLATHLRLGRNVAIKLLNPELASDDVFRRRFLRESQAAAGLEHPNIVPVYDAGEMQGRAYISMRFVDGMDLSALLKSEGHLSPEQTISIIAQVASALDAAHEHGLIHRDVKPANILLEQLRAGDARPRAFLSDFGITKLLSGQQTTESGQFIGTIDYTAPEQITGTQLEPATDQYSLACVLFQSLTGAVPFPRGSDLAAMYAHLEETPPRVSDRVDLSSHIDPVIQRALAKAPAQRFGSCSELVTSAADALGVEAQTIVPTPTGTMSSAPPGIDRTTERVGRQPRGGGSRHARGRRRRGLVALVVAVLLVAGIAGAFAVMNDHRGTQGAPTPSATTAGASTAPSTGPSLRHSPLPKPFPQGFSWRQVSSPVFAAEGRQAINRAVVGKSSIVAVGFVNPSGTDGGDPVVWRTSDGVTWERSDDFETGTQGMDAVALSGKNFVAVGTQNEEQALVWIIPADESLTWGPVDPTGISGGSAIHKIISTSAGLVAVGWASGPSDHDASVWSSGAGKQWNRVTGDAFVGPPGSNQEMWGVTEFSGGLIAVGSDDRRGDPDAAFWLHSGKGWSESPISPVPDDQVVKAVVAGGPGLIAVGSTGSGDSQDAAIWTSANGRRWHPVHGLALPGSQGLTGVIAYGSGFVAVGSDGPPTQADVGVWTSNDGLTWKRSTGEDLTGPGLQFAHGVVDFRGKLVVVGNENLPSPGQAAVWIGTPIRSSSPPGSPTGVTAHQTTPSA
ncbi:MAG: protein kinase domain-containing protein [Actinomycetota bacterium]